MRAWQACAAGALEIVAPAAPCLADRGSVNADVGPHQSAENGSVQLIFYLKVACAAPFATRYARLSNSSATVTAPCVKRRTDLPLEPTRPY